jgi:hypothetical protein
MRHLIPLASWNRWKESVIGAVVLTFILVPLVTLVRDRSFKWFLETPDYALSVFVCAPLATVEAWIEDSQGNKYPVPDAKAPSPFSISIQNSGTKHLDDSEFIILFRSKTKGMKILNLTLASRSPLDKDSYSATFEEQVIRVTAKRINSDDFIYAQGHADAPITIEVFSRSIGLSTSESRAPGCGFIKPSIDRAYVFFTWTSTHQEGNQSSK